MVIQNSGRPRIQSIDLLRGFVMIIMALDHTRDFFHSKGFSENPLNPDTTTVWLYFTRWITHFCAPAFIFLAGASAYLQGLRKNKKELSLFLVTRGFWLILVEIIVLNFAFSFDAAYMTIALQVIWATGISMIILGLLIWLPFPVILATGIIIVSGHNLLDLYEMNNSSFSLWYAILHRMGFYPFGNGRTFFVLYPFLPWTGLMLVGYCFGKLIYNTDGLQRKKILAWIGTGLILFFIALRASNIYGDPGHWVNHKDPLHVIFSFLNTQKYPPSLLFMCMTIGPSILFLAFFDKAKGKLVKIISVYGRVPFFYYILHFFLIHILSMMAFFTRGHSVAEGTKDVPVQPYFIIPGEGYSLLAVYGIWIAIVVTLYPFCKWYDQYKTDHKEKKWLSYL